MSKVLVSCTCGHTDICDTKTEFYEHFNNTICVRGCFESNGCEWFRNESPEHHITFKRLDYDQKTSI